MTRNVLHVWIRYWCPHYICPPSHACGDFACNSKVTFGFLDQKLAWEQLWVCGVLRSIPVLVYATYSVERKTDQQCGLLRHIFSFLLHHYNRKSSVWWQDDQICLPSGADELRPWYLGMLPHSWHCSLNSINFHPCLPLAVFASTGLARKMSPLLLRMQGNGQWGAAAQLICWIWGNSSFTLYREQNKDVC